MNTSENNSDVAVTPSFSVGAALRQAREQAGLSIADIASRIKFGPRQIEALEADDFSHLPEPAFVRGFVRSYARLLQIDEIRLLDALPQAKPQVAAPVATDTVAIPFPAKKMVTSINLSWIGAAFAVALVLVLFMLLNDSTEPVKPAQVVTESVSLQDPAVAASDAAVASAQQQPESAEVVKPAEPEQKVEPEKKAEPEKKSKPRKPVEPPKPTAAKEREPVAQVQGESAAAAAPVLAATDKPAVTLEQLKRRPMHFVFNDDSWIEVLDAKGVVLLSKMNRSGTEQWIGGPHRAPYEVSIAKPGSVKLYYKGNEIDLSGYAATEVVHLKVE